MERKWIMLKSEEDANINKEEVKLAIQELEDSLIPKGVVCKNWAKPGVTSTNA
jgi:hypothetical protein